MRAVLGFDGTARELLVLLCQTEPPQHGHGLIRRRKPGGRTPLPAIPRPLDIPKSPILLRLQERAGTPRLSLAVDSLQTTVISLAALPAARPATVALLCGGELLSSIR